MFDGVELPKYKRRTQSDLHAELFGETESESGAEEFTQDKTNAIKKQRKSGFSAHPGLSKFQRYRC